MIQAGTNTRLVIEMTGLNKFHSFLKLLNDNGIKIMSTVLYPSVRGNYAGLAVIVDDTDKAISVLEAYHTAYKKRPVFAVQMNEEGPTFGETIEALLDAGYDVENGLRASFTWSEGKTWAIYVPTAPKDYNFIVTALKKFVTEAIPA